MSSDTRTFERRDLSRGLVDDIVAQHVESGEAAHVCMTLPVVRSGPETRQNPIRLKNLLAEAERRLTASDADEALCGRVQATTLRPEAWPELRRYEGLWLWIGPSGAVLVGLPRAWPERVTIGERPWLRPLVQCLSELTEALVLCLRRDGAWALRWNGSELVEGDVPGLPVALEEVTGGDLDEPSLQHHSAGETTRFHGQAINLDDDDLDLEKLVRHVEARLWTASRDDARLRQAPLWLAATEEVAPAYRAVSRLDVAGVIEGSPDRDRLDRIADALDDAQARRSREETEAEVARWKEAELGTTRVERLAAAAGEGRVDQLVVVGDAPVWGRISRDGRTAERCEEGADEALDLVDHALVNTWARGGSIRAAHGTIPSVGSDGMAGLLRY